MEGEVKESVGVRADLMGLPEECLTQIISLTSPRDACRFLAVSPNPALRCSADSDFVWDSFLPSDYTTIVSRSLPPPRSSSSSSSSSKKLLYLHLCNSPILLDKGTLSFWLDKWSGKKSYMIGARELSIAWGDAPHYWSWTCVPESRFPEVAQLQNVCWLDIRGRIETRMLSLNTNYAAYFVYMIGDKSHGLQYPPVKVSVSVVEEGAESEAEEVEASNAYLQARVSQFSPEQRDGQLARKREDGWMEIEIGEFLNHGDGGVLEMRLREVKSLNWKAGIIVQGMEIRPKQPTPSYIH